MDSDPRVFISYSRLDGELFAKSLQKRLIKAGIPVWQDRSDMIGGKGWWQQIADALEKTVFLVLVMTPGAMASTIVRKEWQHARQLGVCVYPVMETSNKPLDFDSLPRWMRSVHFYDLAQEWDKFVAHLKAPCQALRVVNMAWEREASTFFVPRPAEYEAIVDQLLDEERDEAVAITTALRGAGGYGKTTLAEAVCRDERIQRVYYDGILWVTLGENPGNLTDKLNDLIETLTDERPGFTDKESAAARLAQLLADRDMLMVIDDVWNNAHLWPFMQGGQRCSRLITTRDSGTLPDGSREHILDAMKAGEACGLLGHGLDATDSTASTLQHLAKRLGNWPLALKLVNAFLARRRQREKTLSDDIAFVNRRLDKWGITAFDDLPSGNRHQAVAITLGISLEQLTPGDQDRFYELAIFPEDTDIPVQTVERLWSHAGMDDADTEFLCENLLRLSLLQRFDPVRRMVRLHDVIRSYLRVHGKDRLASMNALFLAAYPIDRWAEMPVSEPYLWKHLAYHLKASDQTAVLKETLFDYRWLEKKLAVFDINALLADFDDLTAVPGDPVFLLKRVLHLSAHALAIDKQQLAGQVYGRLADQQNGRTRKLLESIDPEHAWLRAVWTHLTPPGPLLRTMVGHADRVTALAVEKSGRRIFSASADGTLKVWRMSNGAELKTLTGHAGPVNDLALTPDGRRAISVSDDHTMKVWDLERLECLKTLKGHTGGVKAIAVSLCGRQAVSAQTGLTAGSLRVWDLERLEEIRTLPSETGHVSGLVFSPDGRCVISSSWRTLKMWRISDGKPVWNIADNGKKQPFFQGSHDDEILAMTISPDGTYLVTGAGAYPALDIVEDASIRIWDLATGEKKASLWGHKDATNALAVTDDNRYVISGGATDETTDSDNVIKVWDVHLKKEISATPPEAKPVTALVVVPGTLTVAAGYFDGRIKIWDAANVDNEAHPAPFLGHTGSAVNAVGISSDGKTVISASDDHTIRRWNVTEKKMIYETRPQSDRVQDIDFLPGEQQFIAVGWDMKLRVYELATGSELKCYGCQDVEQAYATAAAPDGRWCAVATCSGGEVVLWDLSAGKKKKILTGHKSSVRALVFTPDSTRLLSGADDHTIRVWDVRTGVCKGTMEGHAGSVRAIALTPNGDRLASGSLDGSISVWNPETGQRIVTHTHLASGINAVAMFPCGRRIAVGGVDHTLNVVDLNSGCIDAGLTTESAVLSCDVASDGATIAFGEASGGIGIVRLENTGRP